MQAELFERARRGDKEAVASLVELSADRCFGLAYRILRDHHRAQDAVPQALLGAWRDLPALRDLERFDAWLHRLAEGSGDPRRRTRTGLRRCGGRFFTSVDGADAPARAAVMARRSPAPRAASPRPPPSPGSSGR